MYIIKSKPDHKANSICWFFPNVQLAYTCYPYKKRRNILHILVYHIAPKTAESHLHKVSQYLE